MLSLSRTALALAGAASLAAPSGVGASPQLLPIFIFDGGSLAGTSVYRGGRYDRNLILVGSSGEAVQLCIRAAQRDTQSLGRVMAIDIQSIERTKVGFGVNGSVMISQNADARVAQADFRCKTEQARVTSLMISKWRPHRI